MKYTAGRRDRGDIEVVFEPEADGNGITVELTTSVERLYGENIRREITATLEKLGVENCTISAFDDGALPYVIQARVEAAVRMSQKKS